MDGGAAADRLLVSHYSLMQSGLSLREAVESESGKILPPQPGLADGCAR